MRLLQMSGGEQLELYDSPFSDKTVDAIPLSFSSIEEAKYVFEVINYLSVPSLST